MIYKSQLFTIKSLFYSVYLTNSNPNFNFFNTFYINHLILFYSRIKFFKNTWLQEFNFKNYLYSQNNFLIGLSSYIVNKSKFYIFHKNLFKTKTLNVYLLEFTRIFLKSNKNLFLENFTKLTLLSSFKLFNNFFFFLKYVFLISNNNYIFFYYFYCFLKNINQLLKVNNFYFSKQNCITLTYNLRNNLTNSLVNYNWKII